MIKPVSPEELDRCGAVIRESFLTVAKEFGITQQNCPANPAFLQTARLSAELARNNLLYGYYQNGEIVGFFLLEKKSDDLYYLERLAVLPAYRHSGIGGKILEFSKAKVRELGGKMISIGIIEENTILKDWYIQHGFVHTGTRKFEHLPFTVGFMECDIPSL